MRNAVRLLLGVPDTSRGAIACAVAISDSVRGAGHLIVPKRPERVKLAGVRTTARTPRGLYSSASMMAFSVGLGRIAAVVFTMSGW